MAVGIAMINVMFAVLIILSCAAEGRPGVIKFLRCLIYEPC